MVQFLSAIGDAIVSAINFVISFFGDVVYMIQLTGKFLLAIPSYLSWLPPSLVASIMTIIAIVVVYKVIGREG